MKKLKAFTLIELMVVVIIVGILATLGIPAYRNYLEESKAKVCDMNLKALHAALEIYVMEQGAIPASLSLLPQKTLDRGYAKVMQNNKNSWKIEIAYCVLGLVDKNYAYAQTSLMRLAKGNRNILICPSDNRSDSNKVSYAINSQIAGYTQDDLVKFNEFVIADYNSDINHTAFVLSESTMEKRHAKFIFFGSAGFAQGIHWSGESVGDSCSVCLQKKGYDFNGCMSDCMCDIDPSPADCLSRCTGKCDRKRSDLCPICGVGTIPIS